MTATHNKQPPLPNEATFCRDWLREKQERIASSAIASGIVFHAVSIVADQMMIFNEPARRMLSRVAVHAIRLSPVALTGGLTARRWPVLNGKDAPDRRR